MSDKQEPYEEPEESEEEQARIRFEQGLDRVNKLAMAYSHGIITPAEARKFFGLK